MAKLKIPWRQALCFIPLFLPQYLAACLANPSRDSGFLLLQCSQALFSTLQIFIYKADTREIELVVIQLLKERSPTFWRCYFISSCRCTFHTVMKAGILKSHKLFFELNFSSFNTTLIRNVRWPNTFTFSDGQKQNYKIMSLNKTPPYRMCYHLNFPLYFSYLGTGRPTEVRFSPSHYISFTLLILPLTTLIKNSKIHFKVKCTQWCQCCLFFKWFIKYLNDLAIVCIMVFRLYFLLFDTQRRLSITKMQVIKYTINTCESWDFLA